MNSKKELKQIIILKKKKLIQSLNKDNEYIDIKDFFVIDSANIIIRKNKLVKKESKNKIKNKKHVCKISIKIINELNDLKGEYFIEIMKTLSNFKEGEIYIISKELLEQVNEQLWFNILNK